MHLSLWDTSPKLRGVAGYGDQIGRSRQSRAVLQIGAMIFNTRSGQIEDVCVY